MEKFYRSQTAYCAICNFGYRGEGSGKAACNCFDLGIPKYSFEIGDCVQISINGETEKHLWVIRQKYVVNALELHPRSGGTPSHVACYTLQSCQYEDEYIYCIDENLLVLWPCEY